MWKALVKVITIVILGVLTQGCQQDQGAEEKCSFVQNSKGRRVSWLRFPIRFYADKSIDQQTYRAIQVAMDRWNERFSSPVFELLGRTDQLPQPSANGEPPKDGYNGIYMIPQGRGFGPQEQARTSLHHRGDFISESDIIINGALDFYVGDESLPVGERKIELTSLIIHEAGHALGLDHIDDQPSVMQSRLNYGEVRKEIQAAELDALTCEYQ